MWVRCPKNCDKGVFFDVLKFRFTRCWICKGKGVVWVDGKKR